MLAGCIDWPCLSAYVRLGGRTERSRILEIDIHVNTAAKLKACCGRQQTNQNPMPGVAVRVNKTIVSPLAFRRGLFEAAMPITGPELRAQK